MNLDRVTLDKLEYIHKQIKEGNISVLPEKLAIGTVYKIPYQGDLMNDGYELGFLYLSPNSGIKEHIHINDIEMYKPLVGILSVKGEQSEVNYCLLEETHNIDPVLETTIIETVKVNKNYIDSLNQENHLLEQDLLLEKVYQKINKLL